MSRTSYGAVSPRVTIVVPCHNVADVVDELIETVAASNLASDVQMVLVDDGSTDTTADVIREAGTTHKFVESIILPENAGAGVARNAGFAQAAAPYALFFDADDTLHPEALAHALDEMELQQADLAVLPYSYDRGDGYVAMNKYDADVWARLVGSQPRLVGELADMPRLLGMSNYPWNKVLRTDTYAKGKLRFGTTPVHNDVLGHWCAFIHAQRIVLLNEVICTHRIHANRQQLTTRRSRDRLTLFDALDETYAAIETYPAFRARYAHHYWAFVVRVVKWAEARITPEHRQSFVSRVQDHVSRIDLADYFSMSVKRSPHTVRELTKMLMN